MHHHTQKESHSFLKEVLHCNLGGLEFEIVLTPAWQGVPIVSLCNSCEVFTMLVTFLIAMAKYLIKSILKMKDLQPFYRESSKTAKFCTFSNLNSVWENLIAPIALFKCFFLNVLFFNIIINLSFSVIIF